MRPSEPKNVLKGASNLTYYYTSGNNTLKYLFIINVSHNYLKI